MGKDISKVSETSLVSLHIELQRCAPALDSFLSWCIAFFGSDVPFPAPIRALYIALGKSSPVCALLPPLDSLATLYQKLMDNEPIKQFPEYMLLLQQCCPILFDIVRIIDGGQLPDALCTLITDLLVKAKSPFSVDSVTDGEPESSPIHDLEYFPNLPIVRSRGDYCFDEVSSNICTKKSNRHPSLLPGIFLLLCQHGRNTTNINVTIVLRVRNAVRYEGRTGGALARFTDRKNDESRITDIRMSFSRITKISK